MLVLHVLMHSKYARVIHHRSTHHGFIWHVRNGTSLQELQQLGGWTSFEMVLRYAHLSSDYLRDAAERVNVTFSLHTPFRVAKNNALTA